MQPIFHGRSAGGRAICVTLAEFHCEPRAHKETDLLVPRQEGGLTRARSAQEMAPEIRLRRIDADAKTSLMKSLPLFHTKPTSNHRSFIECFVTCTLTVASTRTMSTSALALCSFCFATSAQRVCNFDTQARTHFRSHEDSLIGGPPKLRGAATTQAAANTGSMR